MAKQRIRIGGYQGDKSVHTRAVHDFTAALDTKKHPELEIAFRQNITQEGLLAADLLRFVAEGELDICYFSTSYLTNQIPALGSFDVPFAFPDRAEFHAFIDGPAGKRAIGEAKEQSPYQVLGFWDNGIRHISNRHHEITRPSDCKGLRLRTLKSNFHQSIFRALGFEPHAIDVRDLPGAVASGEIDAQENPLTNIVNFGLYTHHRFVSLTAHFNGVAALLCNREAFEAWPLSLKESVCAAAAFATGRQRTYAAEEDERCIAFLQSEGVQVTRLSSEQRAAFISAVAHVPRE
ncbi:MAG: TRAP transporter substrate-binding protein [Hyphomicrobiaceae bacterium]